MGKFDLGAEGVVTNVVLEVVNWSLGRWGCGGDTVEAVGEAVGVESFHVLGLGIFCLAVWAGVHIFVVWQMLIHWRSEAGGWELLRVFEDGWKMRLGNWWGGM